MISDLWLRFVLRPLGRLLRTDRWQPHIAAMVRCLECQHRHAVVIPADAPAWDPETEALYGLECTRCGAMACTSLGEVVD